MEDNPENVSPSQSATEKPPEPDEPPQPPEPADEPPQAPEPAAEPHQPAAEPPQPQEDDDRPTRTEFICKRIQIFYNHKYYWETLKSVIMFLLGLKLANECYHIIIPIRDYEPFKGMYSGRYAK